MLKPTKRKAFNFLRSYFDVINELDNDADKLKFLMAILNKSFLDEEPKDLNFIVNLCYASQKHALDSSVKGWKTATKNSLMGDMPTSVEDTLEGGVEGVGQEEKEKEKEKEKEDIYIPPQKTFNDLNKEHDINPKDKKPHYKNASEFLADWNNGRIKIMHVKASNMKKLSYSESEDFKQLINDYTIDEFKDGMRGLFKQQNTIEAMRTRPAHFLKDGNIEKYIDAHKNNKQLYNDNKQPVKSLGL